VSLAARPFQSARGISFSFTLPERRATSAGVYDASGTLVRTLWSGEVLPAGANTGKWDQKDNAGVLCAAGTYQIKLVHGKVTYVWDGCVGNSSWRDGDISKMHSLFHAPTCIVTVPGKVFFTGGYNEGQYIFSGFSDKTPQLNDQVPAYIVDPFISVNQFAVDETRLYFVSYGGFGNTNCFVFALSLNTTGTVVDAPRVGFSSGTPLCLNYRGDPETSSCYEGQNYSSNRSGSGGVIALKNDLTSVPSGIAVQRFGSRLVVAYPSESLIRTFDKVTGVEGVSISTSMLVGRFNQIAMTASGDLWVMTGTGQISKFSNLDSTPTLVNRLNLPITDPLAIAADPNDGRFFWIVEGGTKQQALYFNDSGELLRTIGIEGGSLSTALLSSDRFNFSNGQAGQSSCIAVDVLGNIWITDTGSNRLMKFVLGNSQAVEIIQSRPVSYCATVDSGNPTRVFSNFMEYSVNYSKPLSDNTSWTLVKNWLSVMPSPYKEQISSSFGFNGFNTVRTLHNGRTYAMSTIGSGPVMFELMSNNQLRPLPPLRAPDLFTNPNPFGAGSLGGGDTPLVFYENGDLGYTSNLYPKQEVKRLSLLGFDVSNNPIWSQSPTRLASIPLYAPGYEKTPQHVFAGGYRFPMTTTNVVIWLNASEHGDGYHLGGVDLGGTSFKWQASKAGPLDFKGSYQSREYNPGLQYAGNLVFTLDKNVFYGYHGEFYRDVTNGRVAQANQFMHFYDNGLFIGQFGVPSTQTAGRQKGCIGNAFSWTIISHNNSNYIYSNDESTFGGVTRWKIDGLGTIRELTGSTSTGNSTALS
jgi:hypothetical protein